MQIKASSPPELYKYVQHEFQQPSDERDIRAIGTLAMAKMRTLPIPHSKEPLMGIALDSNQLLSALEKVMVISTTDLQGNITYANDLFCQLTGFAREELIGQPHSIVRHPDVPKAVYKEMWDTIKAGKIWTGIVANLGKGGVLYVVDTTVQPLYDEEGNINAYISIRRVVNDLMTNFEAVEAAKEYFDDYYASR